MKNKHASFLPRTAVFLSLSDEQIFRNGNTASLESFITESRFPFNSECDQFLIIHSKKKKSARSAKSKLVLMSKLELYATAKPNLVKAMINTVKSKSDLNHGKTISRLGKIRKFLQKFNGEILSISLEKLDGKRFYMRYLVGTNSYLISGLPRIFSRHKRNVERILIWYSINSVPISKKELNTKSNLPLSFKDCIDNHFVWDEFQASDLREQGVKEATVKGSMLFYPRTHPEARSIKHKRDKRIVFFDITPMKVSQRSFYSTQASIDTLYSLIEFRKLLLKSTGVDVEIALKPKRSYSRIHDPVYIELINQLKDQCEIILLSSESDLYHEISNTDMVLAPPFSSPCIVAKELEIPSVFYFRSDSHWKLPDVHHGINVVISVEELMSHSENLFR